MTMTFDNSPPDGTPGALVGFVGGRDARAFARLGKSERRRAVLGCFESLFGPRAQAAEHYLEQDWARERWSGGGPVATSPPAAGPPSGRRCASRSARSTGPAPRPRPAGRATSTARSARASARPPRCSPRLLIARPGRRASVGRGAAAKQLHLAARSPSAAAAGERPVVGVARARRGPPRSASTLPGRAIAGDPAGEVDRPPVPVAGPRRAPARWRRPARSRGKSSPSASAASTSVERRLEHRRRLGADQHRRVADHLHQPHRRLDHARRPARRAGR